MSDVDPTFDAPALAEVARDLAALEERTLEEQALEALRPDARAAALAAWSALAVGASDPVAIRPAPKTARPPLRALARPAAHWVRWAALLLVGLGVTLGAVLSTPEAATAGLRLGTVQRLDQAAGSHETTSGRSIPWGERLAVGAHEVLGFRLPDGSAVVLRDEGAIRPSRDADGRAVLGLEAGTARAAVAQGGEVRFAIGACRLDLLEGRASVSAEGHVLALGPSARCRLRGPDAPPRILEGPLEARCQGPGQLELLPGTPAPARFTLPSAFAVDHVGRTPGRPVPARLWRVREGAGQRVGTSIRIGPDGVRLAWRPSPDVRRARSVRLRLVGAKGLAVSLDAVGGETLASEPTTVIHLPPGWCEAPLAEGAELVLTLRWTADGTGDARFLGAVFLTAEETTKE